MRALTLIDYVSIMCTLVVGFMSLMGSHLTYALPLPANNTLSTKLTDTLKSITSNVSTSIHSDIDKVISDTMDITISSAMSQLSNATILGNNDEGATVKFQSQIPSTIGVSSKSLPMSEFGSLDK